MTVSAALLLFSALLLVVSGLTTWQLFFRPRTPPIAPPGIRPLVGGVVETLGGTSDSPPPLPSNIPAECFECTPTHEPLRQGPFIRWPCCIENLHTLCAHAGLPLLEEPNPSPPEVHEGGYHVLLLAVTGPRLDRVVEGDGFHEEGTELTDPTCDLRALLHKFLLLGLIEAWHGIPGVGVHLQLHFEQLEWWYTWVDWRNMSMPVEWGRADLHTWC